MRNRNARAEGNAKKMSNSNAECEGKIEERGNAKVHRNARPSLLKRIQGQADTDTGPVAAQLEEQGFTFFAFLQDAAGAALKRRLRLRFSDR